MWWIVIGGAVALYFLTKRAGVGTDPASTVVAGNLTVAETDELWIAWNAVRPSDGLQNITFTKAADGIYVTRTGCPGGNVTVQLGTTVADAVSRMASTAAVADCPSAGVSGYGYYRY